MNRSLLAIVMIVAAVAAVAAVAEAQTEQRPRLKPQGVKPADATAEKHVEITKAGAPANAPLPEGVLATGSTPLTKAMIAEMAETLGRATGSPLNATEVHRLEQRALDFWKRSEGYQDSVREAYARLVKEAEQVESFPAAARRNAWKEAERRLLAETKERPETVLADALRRAESVTHDQYVLGDPPFSKSSAQAFYEMRDYLADLSRGRVKPPSVGEVFTGGAAVAAYFQTAPDEERRFLHAADRAWALARAHLAAAKPQDLGILKRRAAEALAKPGALDAAGLPSVATVRDFFRESGLAEPRADCYWAVTE
jgi:hypothetical protein